jgi:hypothetical protein
MIDLNKLKESAAEYFGRAFDDSTEHIAKAITEDGGVKLTLTVKVDGNKVESGLRIAKLGIKVEPESTVIDDDGQGQLPIEGGGTVTIATAGMEPVTVTADSFQRAVRKKGVV